MASRLDDFRDFDNSIKKLEILKKVGHSYTRRQYVLHFHDGRLIKMPRFKFQNAHEFESEAWKQARLPMPASILDNFKVFREKLENYSEKTQTIVVVKPDTASRRWEI